MTLRDTNLVVHDRFYVRHKASIPLALNHLLEKEEYFTSDLNAILLAGLTVYNYITKMLYIYLGYE